jgi:hypothetical protein
MINIMVKALPDSAIPDMFQGWSIGATQQPTPRHGYQDVPGTPRGDRHKIAEDHLAAAFTKRACVV